MHSCKKKKVNSFIFRSIAMHVHPLEAPSLKEKENKEKFECTVLIPLFSYRAVAIHVKSPKVFRPDNLE